MQKEPCESKVANLLANLDKLSTPEEKISVLVQAVEDLQRQIEEKPTIKVLADKETYLAHTFEMHFLGENYVWFRARTPQFDIDTLCLRGEV